MCPTEEMDILLFQYAPSCYRRRGQSLQRCCYFLSMLGLRPQIVQLSLLFWNEICIIGRERECPPLEMMVLPVSSEVSTLVCARFYFCAMLRLLECFVGQNVTLPCIKTR